MKYNTHAHRQPFWLSYSFISCIHTFTLLWELWVDHLTFLLGSSSLVVHEMSTGGATLVLVPLFSPSYGIERLALAWKARSLCTGPRPHIIYIILAWTVFYQISEISSQCEYRRVWCLSWHCISIVDAMVLLNIGHWWIGEITVMSSN